MRTAACRSCGAPMIWTMTENRRKMPVDAEPNPKGRFELYDRGEEYVFPDGSRGEPGTPMAIFMPQPGVRPKYESHFVTCPNAAQHRRKP